ncbi:tau 95 subunit of transcription factor TFIIIC [Quaeritorhiza haematococci]|nr:tau 95 subunit of transcription factor TFIIIC [Quaeritorhiza haematococci]
MNADSNNSSYARAPSKPLPKWMFHVIEYPGYVADIEKVFLTLGGHQSIEKSFNEQDLGSLELRYRPEDMFSHPISGDVINTSNLLLKVTRRRRKRPIPGADPSENQQTKMEIVGVINKTCRFRGIADFQYIPDQTDSIVQLRKALHNWDVEGVEHFQFSEDKGAVAPLRNMPPPAFSRVEWPQNYNYRQNEAVVKVLIKRRGDEAPVMKLINRHRRQKFVVVNFDAKWKTVPVAPPEDISAHLADVPQASLDRIKALFEKRPVWTRAAVKNNLEPEDRKHLKALLPLVSYVVTNGPWRDCWIRYGYDPRKDVEARFYQIIYVRNVKDRRAQTQAWRAKRLRGIGDSSDLVRPKLNYEAPEKKGWDEGSGSADTQ